MEIAERWTSAKIKWVWVVSWSRDEIKEKRRDEKREEEVERQSLENKSRAEGTGQRRAEEWDHGGCVRFV